MITMSILTSTTVVEFVNTTLENHLTKTTSTIPFWVRILTVTCMILIDISAFFGNLLVICAFFRTRRLQTVTNYFIASLAFADALVALFVLPLSIYSYQSVRSWKLGLILCDLWVSSDVLLCTSSILNLTCISVDRYMAITRPLTYTAYRSKFLARVMILLVWIVSVVITCPPIFGWRDSNRRYTVEQEHRCDLNTARSYVVYSALGSFYIPAVVMIFVYIRIFMVVYDRENLIKKFHDDNNNTSNQISLKTNQNGTNLKQSNKSKKSSSCCCLCFRRNSQKILTHQTSNHNCTNSERKQNGYLVYRFTNNNHNSSSNSVPDTPPLISKSTTTTTMFCRPCTISTKKMTNASNDMYHSRRNYLSGFGAEYQFRTCESPCYELKTFENSLPPLIKCRSHSFEQSSSCNKPDSNTELKSSTTFNDNQQNPIDNILLSDKDTNQSSSEYLNKPTQSLNELTEDIPDLSIIKQSKSYEINHRNNISNSSTYSNISDQKSLPEKTRINRSIKPSRKTKSTPSAILIENFKLQHKFKQNNHSKTNQSNHHTNENINKKSTCSCCLTPFNNWYESKNKQICICTPNHSLTNDDDDDDDDDKLSSNEANTRTPIIIASNLSLRTIDNSNPTNLLLSSSRHQQLSSRPTINPSNDVNRRERIRFMKEQKTAKTLAIVVGGFILFWLPFFIMYIIPSQTYSFDAQTVTLITWLGYCNSVINPFIYAYCSKQFRMAFWNITFGMCIKKSNTSIPISLKTKQLHQRHINA